MTQTRYTLQQHHVNLKSSVKLSHVNMYHCESPASNIFPGHPYSKIIFIQKGQGQFYFGNQFLPVRENDLLLVNPDKQKFSVDVRESPLDFVILGIENLSFIDDTKQCIPPFTRLSFPSDTCQHLMHMLIHELEKHSEFYEDAYRYYLNLILIEIQRNTNIHYDFPSKEKNNRDCKFVKEYLDSHYTENITLDILSKKVRWTNIILFILLQSTLAVPQSVISMTNELKKVRTYLKQPIILLQPLLLWLVFPRNLTSHNLLRKILLWLRMNTGGLHGRFKPHNFIVHRIINWNYFIYYIIRVLFSFSISGLFYHFLLLFSILTAHFTFFPSLLVIIFSCFIWKKRLSYSIMI